MLSKSPTMNALRDLNKKTGRLGWMLMTDLVDWFIYTRLNRHPITPREIEHKLLGEEEIWWIADMIHSIVIMTIVLVLMLMVGRFF